MRQIHPSVAAPQVWIWRDRHGRPQAHCDCGWDGQPRWLRSHASTDALLHTVHTEHYPADPIDVWQETRRGRFFADLHAAFWMLCFIAIMAIALGYSVVPR